MNRHVMVITIAAALTMLPHGLHAQSASTASGDSRQREPQATGLLAEPRVIDKGLEFAGRLLSNGDGGEAKNGFYPEFGNMVTGAGWISAGPGYRRWLLHDRAFVDASAAISWRAYKMAQVRFELPALARSRVTLGSQLRWQDLTQVTYFGGGPDSLVTDRTEYRLKTTNAIGYAVVRPAPSLAIHARLGWLGGLSMGPPAGSFGRDNPATSDLFPDDPVFLIGDQPDFIYGEASVTHDTRDHRGHPSSGGVYRASWTRYSDRSTETFSFRRYEAEGAHFVPLGTPNVVLALHGWLVASDVAPDQVIPFYLQPSLGGANTLRAYANYRFHDRHLAVVNAETRVAIFRHVDAALLFDAGNVAAAFGDLNLDRTSYGVGFRVHSRNTTFARLDIARGHEGWQLLFRVNDPFRFARLSRRTAPVPFAP